jgi:hypothetical protein
MQKAKRKQIQACPFGLQQQSTQTTHWSPARGPMPKVAVWLLQGIPAVLGLG